MKKNRKKGVNKTKNKQSAYAKVTYIGVGMTALVGVAALILMVRLSDPARYLSNVTPMPLPTAAPVFAQTPAPPSRPTAVPTPAPEVTQLPAEETAAVFHEQAPFAITLPCEGEHGTAFSMEQLVYSKTMGDWRVHSGLDLLTDTGTEVKAAAAGQVTEVYQDALLGYTIVLAHEGGYQTIYQNLASTEMVKAGDMVEAGQCIGATGDSAAAEMLEEAHLHFAVKEGEAFVNPLDFVR